MIQSIVFVNDIEKKLPDMNYWCRENIGKMAPFRDGVDEDRPWHYHYAIHTQSQFNHVYGLKYYFAFEKDAALFALIWT